MLAAIPGVRDLAMTTNGFLFKSKGSALREAGLKRVSFSLDSLSPENFRRMTGRDGLSDVLEGIEMARSLPFEAVKINAVVIQGINDHEIESLAEFALGRGLVMRYIEFMPLDSQKVWMRDLVVSGHQILERLRTRFDLVPVQSQNPSETAQRWRPRSGFGEIGIIAPVTQPFCGHCNRIRLTADGKIRTCLFSVGEHDIKGLLRRKERDWDLESRLRDIVAVKEDRHHIGEPEFKQPSRSMSCIGG